MKKLLIFGMVIIATVGFIYMDMSHKTEYVSYNQFLQNIEEAKVESVEISNGEKLNFSLKNDKVGYYTDNPRKIDLKESLLLKDIKVSENSEQDALNILISFMFLSILAYVVIKKTNHNYNGKKQDVSNTIQKEVVVDKAKKFDFGNVAGNEEAKEGMQDIVDFLKNPDKYTYYGARMPKGVIFYGPPGTGKTLMAKALAGEANVPFFSASGSDFVEMFVGVGAKRVRELFGKAKQIGKAVIFIDEIDAIAKKRTSGGTSGNDERDQTLNALLTEMSGFHDKDGIIVIAATNRLDVLDEALLRPGRFDRQVEIRLPDKNARLKILQMHAQNKPIAESVNLEDVAGETVYFSGAGLENLLNEAAITAAKAGNKFIEKMDIDKAFYTIIAGAEKKDRSGIRNIDRQVTAFHEAGHALVTKIMMPENKVSKVTIIPSTKGAGGFSMNIGEDKSFYTKKDIENQIKVLLAGRCAEEIIFGKENITTGASNDIQKATSMILDYIKKFGMSEKFGLLNLDMIGDDSVNKEIVQESKSFVEKFYKETKELLIEKKYLLSNIAETLLVKETIHHQELEKLMNGEEILEVKKSVLAKKEKRVTKLAYNQI